MTNLQRQSTVYKELAEYFFTKDPKLAKVSDLEKTKFLRLCEINQLDPFKGQIYAIPFETKSGTSLQIVINYKIYLERAERSGDLNGWKVEIDMDKDNKWPVKGKITIHRKGRKHPFEYEVDFDEASQGKHLSTYKNTWADSPKFMLKKTLIKQGFQMAFPLEMDVDDEIEPVDIIEGEINVDELKQIAEGNIAEKNHDPITDEQQQIINELLQIIPDFALNKPTDFEEAEDYIKKIKRDFAKRIKAGEFQPSEDFIKTIFGDDSESILSYINKK